MIRVALAEAEPAEELLFSSDQVRRMTGATPRQTDNWSRKGWIPGMSLEVGCGFPRRWTPEMVETVRGLVLASKCKHWRLPRLAEFVRRAAEAGVFP